jgi:hypothetical protein
LLLSRTTFYDRSPMLITSYCFSKFSSSKCSKSLIPLPNSSPNKSETLLLALKRQETRPGIGASSRQHC